LRRRFQLHSDCVYIQVCCKQRPLLCGACVLVIYFIVVLSVHFLDQYSQFIVPTKCAVSGVSMLKTYLRHVLNQLPLITYYLRGSTSFIYIYIYIYIYMYSFHSVFCLTAGSKPAPKRFLHIARSRASSFK
jgi:hypothetical protein